MVTVTSLYICISYIYTYSYNFYYLSSLYSYCMSIFSVTCSISLAYLLSILLLYSRFYTLHIPYSFYNLLTFMFYYIFFHILLYFYILSILFMCSSFMPYHISYTFHIILYFTSYSCTCILSLHSSAMLIILCHIFFTFHLHILVIFFYVSCMQIPYKQIREITVCTRRYYHCTRQ